VGIASARQPLVFHTVKIHIFNSTVLEDNSDNNVNIKYIIHNNIMRKTITRRLATNSLKHFIPHRSHVGER